MKGHLLSGKILAAFRFRQKFAIADTKADIGCAIDLLASENVTCDLTVLPVLCRNNLLWADAGEYFFSCILPVF